MASEDQTNVFEVKVCDDNQIRVEGTENFPNCPVTIDDLHRRTTQVLVNMLREGRLVDEEEFKVLGEHLYKVLFGNVVGEAVRKSYVVGPTRVELGFEQKQAGLSSWPWEYLYCPLEETKKGSGCFLAGQDNVILTRRLKLDGTPRGLRIDKLPLKVLFVASSPKLQDIERPKQLDANQGSEKVLMVEYESVLEEIKKLGKEMKEKFGEEMIKVTALLPEEKVDETGGVVSRATWENFRALVKTEEPHAIHFLGHGKWDSVENAGAILFMKNDGTVDPCWEGAVAAFLMTVPSLRLVFLQACESAQSDPYQAFSGVAEQLAQKGIPAVVGMQTKINHLVANRFARTFYEALADRLTVDAAVQKARATMSDASSDSVRRLGFGLPVLYLQNSEPLFAPVGPTGIQAGAGVSPAGPTTPPLPEFVNCPWCGARNKSNNPNCRVCAGPFFCEHCKARVEESGQYCVKCTEPLKQPRTSPPKKDNVDGFG